MVGCVQVTVLVIRRLTMLPAIADVDTLRSLEDALMHFDGCAVVVSHDRYFLDRVCTHTIAFEGNGKVEYFDGNYQEYEDYKVNVLGQEAADGEFEHSKLKLKM